MIRDIRFSEEFDKAFKRLKKKYKSLPDDFKKLLLQLTDNPYQGAELHDGMRKVRMRYDKSDMESVSDAFLDDIILKINEET